MTTLYSGQRPTGAAFNTSYSQPVQRGRRTTDSTTTTTEQGVLRLDGISVTSGCLYVVKTNPLYLDSSVTNDEIYAQLRYTTDGSSATTSSTVLPGARVQVRQTDANVEEPKAIVAFYAPSSDETLSLLLTVGRIAGTGNCKLAANVGSIDLYVGLLGTDPGDTGVDI